MNNVKITILFKIDIATVAKFNPFLYSVSFLREHNFLD